MIKWLKYSMLCSMGDCFTNGVYASTAANDNKEKENCGADT